ncbi:MAG TPA: hypothetical protein VGU64_12115, partial [Terriglobales bacterium]|nr:hypothetical protein [Terriglobales bacterium]
MSHNAPICLSDLFFSAHFANSLRTLRLRAFNRKGPKGSAQRSQRKACRTQIAVFVLLAICVAGPRPTVRAETEPSSLPIQYTIALADLAAHKVHVTVTLPPGATERDLQLPVWNALYQVRDFSQYVNWIRAKNHQGGSLPIRLLDKSRWRVSDAVNGAEVEYEILAVLPGPYG